MKPAGRLYQVRQHAPPANCLLRQRGSALALHGRCRGALQGPVPLQARRPSIFSCHGQLAQGAGANRRGAARSAEKLRACAALPQPRLRLREGKKVIRALR